MRLLLLLPCGGVRRTASRARPSNRPRRIDRVLRAPGPGLRAGGVPRPVVQARRLDSRDREAAGALFPDSVVLALALLVAPVLADDHDPAVPPDHLALRANRLDAWLDLHQIFFRDARGGRVPSLTSWLIAYLYR